MSDQHVFRRILVTGAAGFIGSHVVDRLLSDGITVWGVDNFDDFYPRLIKEGNLEAARAHPRFQLAEGDLRDESFLTRLFSETQFDAVVHMAARAGVRPSIQAPDAYYDTNVMGTLRLLETMRRFQVNALVFASSSSVYGASGHTGAFSEEDDADHPLSPYAATKRACELLCHSYWHLHGLACYCLRLFTVYGPRQRPDLAIHKFTRALLAGEAIPMYGDGSADRDYTFVHDVVDAIAASLDQAVLHGAAEDFTILNIGANRTVKLKELINLLGEATGVVPQLDLLPPQPGDVPHTWADVSRAREILGYEPSVRIEEGLSRFVDWFKEQQDREAAFAIQPEARSES